MKALVTGANGFLGRRVVDALKTRGHAVRAMVRPAACLDDLPWAGSVEIVRADLRSTRDLEAAFAGVDMLVHLAAAVSGGDDAQFASTVVGTERLLRAMARTSCTRVVLVSSFSVYDWSAIRGTLDERSPLEPVPDLYQRDGYTIAKAWQERVTRRAAEQHGWELTVLRPGYIWGRDHAYVAALGQKVGRLYFAIGPTIGVPLTHVENCAALCALAADDPRATGCTFNVVDGEEKRVWTLLGAYLKGTGQRGFRIPVPYQLAWQAIRLASATIFRRSRKLPHFLVPCRFESRLKPLRYTSQSARDVLGWRPLLSFEQCLERTYGVPSPPTVGPRPAEPAPEEALIGDRR